MDVPFLEQVLFHSIQKENVYNDEFVESTLPIPINIIEPQDKDFSKKSERVLQEEVEEK